MSNDKWDATFHGDDDRINPMYADINGPTKDWPNKRVEEYEPPERYKPSPAAVAFTLMQLLFAILIVLVLIESGWVAAALAFVGAVVIDAVYMACWIWADYHRSKR